MSDILHWIGWQCMKVACVMALASAVAVVAGFAMFSGWWWMVAIVTFLIMSLVSLVFGSDSGWNFFG